jgi:hypothetical protein
MLHAAMRSRAILKNGRLRARFALALPSQCAMQLRLKLRRFVCAGANCRRPLSFHDEMSRVEQLRPEAFADRFLFALYTVFTGGELAIPA